MHICNIDFGEDVAGEAVIENLLQGKRVSSWSQAQQILAMAYNTQFGIFNHIAQEALDTNPAVDPKIKRPLALIAAHPAEEYRSHSLLERLIEIFPNKKIGQHFNISFTDFMECPPEVVEKMIAVCDKINERESAQDKKTLEAVENSMENLSTGKP